MTHITCRLTAKNRDQLRNPTLGNRVRATFTVLTLSIQCNVDDYDYVVRISSMHLTNLHVFDDVFTARRYASAVFAVVMCPSIPPLSVRRKPVFYRNDWTNRGGFWHGGFLPPIPHCSIRKCGYLQKLEYFPLDGSLSQTPDFRKNFATVSRSRCQQHSSSSSTVELVDDIYTTVEESWLFTTSRKTVTL